ncbi:MAG: TIGR02921 family PEP-CTERM protein [Prochloraceae cyanobacterium]|nr:TIGR02921 family PEP-CTERM protein [Prochloraceae cyanobacterium]
MKSKSFNLIKIVKPILNVSFHSIFWLWNLIFLTVVGLGLLPFVGIALIVATIDGDIPFEFFISFVTLIAVPTICTLIGIFLLRKQPRELIRLFYGVEAPLFVLCLLRLFVFRELTPASTLVLGTIFLCIFAFGLELVAGYAKENKILAWLQLVAHSLMLLIGCYMGLVLLFYAVPVAFTSITYFFSFQWVEPLINSLSYIINPFTLLFFVLYLLLFVFSCTLFVGMPSAITALYLHSGQRILRAFAKQYGRNKMIQGTIAVLGVWLILFFSFNVQPQVQAFNLLDKPAQTDSDRQAILAKSNVIRRGLVNANLYPYRYLGTTKENNHIYVTYKNVFGFPDSWCQSLQNTYNELMLPFLYRGAKEDTKKASKFYAEFFDIPLQKAERQAVQHALQSTAIVDQAKAGLINIDQPRVWLRKQEVTVKPQGDWADIELYEVYENKTNDVEEIFYYFSLPESATITGLWLGDTSDRDLRYPPIVSPRGAAQTVYNSQVRRQRPVDPALLEQVGPRSYRLRAFPVPRPLRSWERIERNSNRRPTELHLWLTYKVMQQKQGWALPKLEERRNIFWTNWTKRIRNGKVEKGFNDAWLEDYIPAEPVNPTLHQVNLTDNYRISATPLTKQTASLPKNKHFALILDRSRSMSAHRQEVEETFAWLQKNLSDNDVDLYVTDSTENKAERFDDIKSFNANKITFYGSIQTKELLKEFADLRGDTKYDSIIVITDEGSYELSDDKQKIPSISAPLWLVHLGDKMPPAYDDDTLKALQDSRGGVAEDIATVMQRIAAKETLGSDVVNVVDGYVWKMEKGSAENTSETGFEPFGARQLVLGLSQKMTAKSLEQLDAIHAIAKQYGIVTPYSSTIVLVNDEQRKMLKEAEAASDRFDREVETGVENLNQPFSPTEVSGVPEPEEWMLLGIVAIGLIVVYRLRKGSLPS